MRSIPWKVGFWECFGAIVFSYGIISSSQPYTAAIGPFIPSIALFGGILLTAPFSGGHLNPAVSLAFYVKGAYGLTELLTRMIFQVLGAFIGSFIGWAVLDQAGGPFVVGDASNILRAFVGETYGTFIFALVILIITDQKTTYVRNFRDALIVFITIALCGLTYGR